ncbi:MAG: hypothetical protein IGR92_17350 [Leptolyngbyaceae cyanobacterium T60_A2020_046]|nr:hypothetical protein [Leptolyngbyaceae cyanobacterium T60_A2020_046]
MAFFRSYIAPLLIVLTFLVAMLAVSARIFLPSDMLAPAPIETPVGTTAPTAPAAPELSDVSVLLHGQSDFAG